jgi:RNA polymerase sigma-70 factor (ECF subfamily)
MKKKEVQKVKKQEEVRGLSQNNSMNDEELLRLSLGDPSYFSLLVDKYHEAFLRAAISITRSREEAEDILQETFTKIYLNGHKYKKEPGASFKSWAYKILVNTSFTHYQKLKKTTGNVSYLDPVLYEDTMIAESRNVAGDVDDKALVLATIAKMPEHLGRLLKLYYLEDKSYKDIAKVEKISSTTLKMRLFRAKKIFKKLLDKNKVN